MSLNFWDDQVDKKDTILYIKEKAKQSNQAKKTKDRKARKERIKKGH